MGVSIIEEEKPTCCLSPKIYQQATDMDGPLRYQDIEIPRRKKMYASSSFFEEPNAIYPTIQEQVQLCRQIAASLSDDQNVKSKGANMFFKRVKRAEKWVVAESKEEESNEDKDPASMPYVRPSRDGPPKLKLILAPRQVIDLNYLIKEGVEIVQHNAISPEVCHTIVKDLNSPTGKGAELFAKRKKKSEEWIVDDEKVKHLMETRYQSGGYSSPEPSGPTLSAEIDFNALAENVITAAESKVMSYPNAVPHVPVIKPLVDVSSQQQSEAYKLRAPKGWTGSTTASPLPSISEDSSLPEKTSSTITPVPHELPRYSPICRSKSFSNFNNFNSTPRAWNSDIYNKFRPAVIKPVKPPSVLVQ